MQWRKLVPETLTQKLVQITEGEKFHTQLNSKYHDDDEKVFGFACKAK